MDLDAAPGVGQWQDGMWHLALTAWERKEVGQKGDTHFLKPNPSKAEREAMSEEQRHDLPIVGNLRPISEKPRQAAAQGWQNAPQQGYGPAPALPQTNDPAFFKDEDDDLPF